MATIPPPPPTQTIPDLLDTTQPEIPIIVSESKRVIKINKLNDDNYMSWKLKMQLVLEERGLWDNKDKLPLPTHDAWREIIFNVEDDQLLHIEEMDNGRTAWLKLQKEHESRGTKGERVDSGPSKHLCGNRSLLFDMEPIQKFKVYVADGTAQEATHKGSAKIQINHDQHLIIPKVYYVPTFSCNLLSISELSQNFDITFKNKSCTVTKNGQNLVSTTRTNGIYHLPTVQAITHNINSLILIKYLDILTLTISIP
jgi:hypothetical protein